MTRERPFNKRNEKCPDGEELEREKASGKVGKEARETGGKTGRGLERKNAKMKEGQTKELRRETAREQIHI